MTKLKLQKKILFEGYMQTLTGLHIGGTNSAMGIGGPDSSVIRNPVNNQPYIPGSSLKGKMRSLMEVNDGTIGEVPMGQVRSGPSDQPDDPAANLFGTAKAGDSRQRPSKIVVRDAQLLNDIDDFEGTDLPYTETKTEIVLDRITAAAMPRQLERVPAGAQFNLDMVLNLYIDQDQPDDEDQLIRGVLSGLQMVQDDYLGGSGSRGSGRVSFVLRDMKERTADYYKGNDEERSIMGDKNVPDDLKA
jgi:CRISPR-associated protein Csm3